MRTVLQNLGQDLHYALRQLRHSPAFALTAMLTLALGVGVNAAMFSVVDQVLLHSMPFPRAAEVVQLATRSESNGFTSTSLPDVQDWQARSHSFTRLGYFTEQIPTLGGASSSGNSGSNSGSEPKLVAQVVASDNLFDLLEARPILGHAFLPGDNQPGRTTVVILSNSLWREMYHADPHVLGQSVPINGMPYTVIGVMAPGFTFPANSGNDTIWSPLPTSDKALEDRGSASLTVFGRLRPGVPLAEATREMNSIHQQLIHEHPKEEDPAPILVQSYPDVVTGSIRPAILALNVAVVAVWLIACANIAGLLLARGNGRRREIALRSALGAPRSRLIRQFLTESLLLSLAGGALGLGLAVFALHLLKQYLSKAIVFGDQVHIDAKVCAFLFAASCLSAVLFGLLPALHATNTPAQEGLRQGTAASGTSRTQTRWRDALIIGEIALTLTLLVAAGLMVRTLLTLRHTHTGFVADQVTTAELYLPSHSQLFYGIPENQDHPAPSLVTTFYNPLLERLAATPGIQAAGLTTVRPLQADWDFNMGVTIEGKPKLERAAQANAQARATSADYFKTMGIRLLQGRFFASTDSASATPTVIVNEAFVKRFLPDPKMDNPIGQHVRYNDKGARQWSTIVGVVDDSPEKTLGQAPLPEIHYNLAQLLPQDELYPILGAFYMNLAVRSPLSSDTSASAIRHAVHDLAPDAAVNDVRTLQQVVDDSLGNQVLAERLLGLLALTGLGIAVAGIYGLLAYSVSQRTRELGVRLALGAPRQSVLWLILRHALVLLAIGIGLGAAVTAASSKLLTTVLVFKLSHLDALVFVAVAAILSICGLAASYLPAWRAAHIDPITALRTD